MVYKNFWIKMLVMVLVLGTATVGCFGQSIDNRLNGTWVRPLESVIYDESKGDFIDTIIESILIFNSGNYSGGTSNGMTENGTYTTGSGKITIRYTFSNSLFNEIWSYSINNNTLTIIYEDNETFIFTRKN